MQSGVSPRKGLALIVQQNKSNFTSLLLYELLSAGKVELEYLSHFCEFLYGARLLLGSNENSLLY
jgi:hypothetical protein